MQRAGDRRRTACPAAPAMTASPSPRLCPIAMLFVRCKGGISHNPAESITTRDADVATRVLLDFLRHFHGAADARPTAAVAA